MVPGGPRGTRPLPHQHSTIIFTLQYIYINQINLLSKFNIIFIPPHIDQILEPSQIYIYIYIYLYL